MKETSGDKTSGTDGLIERIAGSLPETETGKNLPAAYVMDGVFVKPYGGDMKIKLRYSEIVWVEAENNYSHIHTIKGNFISVACNIQHVMDALPKNLFIRINCSEIVNVYRITKYYGNTLYLDGCSKSFVVSKSFRDQIFNCFNEVRK